MRFPDLRVARRQMAAAPLHTLASLGGLALAVAACLLLATLILERLLPDATLQDPERIVLIDFKGNMPGRQEDWFLRTPFAFHGELKRAGAPLTDVGRYLEAERTLRRAGPSVEDEGRPVRTAALDAELASLFALQSLRGDARQALARPDQLVVTADVARRLFGRVDVLGEALTLGTHTLHVGAVIRTPTARHPVQAEVLLNFDSPAAGLSEDLKTAWFWVSGQVWGRLAPGVSAAQAGAVAQGLLDHSPVIKELPPDWVAGGRKAGFMRALPLSERGFEGRLGQQQRQVLAALLGAGLLLGLLALVNAVNLGGVRMLQRQREIAIRQSLGAGPGGLLGLALAEAGLQALIAVGLGWLMAWLLAPWMAGQLELPQPDVLSGPGLLLCAGLFVLITLVVAAYPAWLCRRLRCAEALQGRLGGEGRSGRWLRRLFGALQFGCALLVVAMALLVWAQNRHVLARDLGYELPGLHALTLPAGTTRTKLEAFQQALRALPGVRGSSWAQWIPGSGRMEQEALIERLERQVTLRRQIVDGDFLDLYRVRLLAGQVGRPSTAEPRLVIDADAARALGWTRPEEAVGQTVQDQLRGLDQARKHSRIVAVVEHLALESTREPRLPQGFLLQDPPESGTPADGPGVLLLRSSPAFDAAQVHALWRRQFPSAPLRLERLEEALLEPYTQDLRLGHLVALCAGLALAIAGFGMYALAAHLVQRHAREIVLRKLHGASTWQSLRRLGRELALLLLAGALIGLPLSWLLGRIYLGGFADQAALGVWPQGIALGGLLAVALLASLRHGLKAVALRPIAVLQD
ncbi:ABC transporter permease [Pelomonas sp. APW6]|uniref:ABC transporter permease n=1 Tax=Roseateles subflavus TaxID=3053353 RepID=A0ABT7LF40_9BURK|nr:ABC transporter permease [Pelomonas sp. APW6]MDL5031469.1 ABC transporter permease [Pelomonas sp. APW6]